MLRDERGLSESAQWAVVFPLLMLLTLGIVQAGIFLHSRHVAQRAAIAAVDEARGSYGSETVARQQARAIAAAGGLNDVSIALRRTSTGVDVDVAGRAPLILDLGLGIVRGHASGPTERVSQP